MISLLFLSVALIGCSGGSDNAMQPGMADVPASKNPNCERIFWGGWEVWFDIERLTADVRSIRYPGNHFNITGMIKAPGCDDCLDITVISFDPETRILDADVTLRNASPYAVRDVRGILYTDDYGHGLENDDGWTGLWDIPGGDNINPFKAFAKEAGGRIFMMGTYYTEKYLVHIPEPAHYSVITFAVDASWPANCAEPFKITNYHQWAIDDVQGASGLISIDVLDWQDDVSEVVLIAPEIADDEYTPFSKMDGVTWGVLLTNNTGASEGFYDAVVMAVSGSEWTPPLYDHFTIAVTPEGFDLDTLFAPPTQDEIDAVWGDWNSRDVGAQNFEIEGHTNELDGRRMFLVSHTVDGEKHYGIVHLPPGMHEPGSLPVLIILHGGATGTSNHELYVGDFIGESFIQVIPSFRGEPMQIIGGPLDGIYQSEGQPGSRDRDADDTIALLTCVLENFEEADGSRVALIGTSRGGGCALRMKVRDERVDGVIDFYGAANYYADSIKAACQAYLNDPAFQGNNPLEHLAITTIVGPLVSGTINIIEARHKLLLPSPIFFCEHLPRVQVHHGANDPIVPVVQSDMLEYYLTNIGITFPDFEYFRYEDGVHNRDSLTGSAERVEQFLHWIVNQD